MGQSESEYLAIFEVETFLIRVSVAESDCANREVRLNNRIVARFSGANLCALEIRHPGSFDLQRELEQIAAQYDLDPTELCGAVRNAWLGSHDVRLRAALHKCQVETEVVLGLVDGTEIRGAVSFDGTRVTVEARDGQRTTLEVDQISDLSVHDVISHP